MNWHMKRTGARTALAALAVAAGGLLAGCPTDSQAEYDRGYADGFADDDLYWSGFADSYDTIDGGTIYYAGDQIPEVQTSAYDAGYYDGQWYAYNDGYFVEYDYAFTIGFSEGYDIAYSAGGVGFIQTDQHIEWLDGGFDDGYNDGFSEGRVFGAYDYNNGISYDWFGAMLDYRDGTDLTVGGVSTGNAGPVELYQYGTDPNTLVKDARGKAKSAAGYSIRRSLAKQTADNGISYRPLTASVQDDFDVTPLTSPRSTRQLQLASSWLDRILDYRDAITAKAKPPVHRGK